MSSPFEYYNRQKEKFNIHLTQIIKKANVVSTLRLGNVLAILLLCIIAYTEREVWLWYLAAIFVALFLILIRVHLRIVNKRELMILNISLIEKELQALQGNYEAFPDGAIHINLAHPYSYDLDLFGKGSIYQMLSRIVTTGGAVLLAKNLLSQTLLKEVILERQETIEELSNIPEFLQNFRVTGNMVKEEPGDQARLTQWLQSDNLFINNKIIRIAIFIMPLLSIFCILWAIITKDIHGFFVLIVMINWILLAIYQKKIKLVVQQISNIAPLIDKYESLLQQVAMCDFNTKWIQKNSLEAKNILEHINRLKKLAHLFDTRSNGMAWSLMNSLFLFDLYCIFRLEAWREKYKLSTMLAIDLIALTDVYVTCAVYAFNNPDYIYPTITETGSEIHAKDLRHPLLSFKNAVGNDLSLGKKERFYLLTGANMTGKSTFIRTIGISNILCNMGLPLPAKELSLPILELYTSMRITDSVQNDISYFRAELGRIKDIMEKVKTTKNHLILLDEPLRGTNSTDKQQGTRSILETLLKYSAIGVIATHDTGLCDMQNIYTDKVSNYHFESVLIDQELSFDFKLKSGCSMSNNATVLMRQMGIINY